MKDKNELRKVLKYLRKSLSDTQRKEYNATIMKQVVDMPEYKESEQIFCYMNYGSEVDTIGIIEQALKDGKKVAVPKVLGEDMEFYEITSIEDCKEGAFHILEPEAGSLVRPNENKKILMLVPGLAFDMNMNRMGYGKGYYDRYFEKYGADHFHRTALAYDLQVVNEVPCNELDVKMNVVITEYKIYDESMKSREDEVCLV